MALTPEQIRTLTKALDADRLVTLSRIVYEVGKHNLDADTKIRQQFQMRQADEEGRRALLAQGLRSGRLVDDLGKAMLSKKQTSEDLVRKVEELVQYDAISSAAIELICTEILSRLPQE